MNREKWLKFAILSMVVVLQMQAAALFGIWALATTVAYGLLGVWACKSLDAIGQEHHLDGDLDGYIEGYADGYDDGYDDASRDCEGDSCAR